MQTINGVLGEAIADGRRREALAAAEKDRRARTARGRQGLMRRALGLAMIRAGERLAAVPAREAETAGGAAAPATAW